MTINKIKGLTKTAYNPGDKVFCKIKGYRAWPAKILSLVHPNKSSIIKYNVIFYGTNESAVADTKNIYPYFLYKDKFGLNNGYKKFNESITALENDIQTEKVAKLDLINCNKVNCKTKTKRRVKNKKVRKKVTVSDTFSPKKYRKKVKKKVINLSQPIKIDNYEALDKISTSKEGGETHVVQKIEEFPEEHKFEKDQKLPKEYYNYNKEIAIKQEAKSEDDEKKFLIVPKVENDLLNDKNIFLIEFNKDNINSNLVEYDKSNINAIFIKSEKDNLNTYVKSEKVNLNTYVKYDEDILNSSFKYDKDTIKTLANYNQDILMQCGYGEDNFIYAGNYPNIVKIPLNLNMPVFTYLKYAQGWDRLVLAHAKLLKKMVEIDNFTEGVYELMDNFTKTLAKVFNEEQEKQLNEWISNVGLMLETNVNIRECLHIDSPNPKKCIEYIDIMKNIPINRLMLKKYPDVVCTINLIRKFTCTMKNALDENAFNESSILREKARNLYNKFKQLFLVPKEKSFWKYFISEVKLFNKRIEGLSPEDIFRIVEETD